MLMRPRMSRRTRGELEIASWLDTGKLAEDGLPGEALDLRDLSPDDAGSLVAAIDSNVTRGALQSLLATRLTDAPESDAADAREAVRAAIAGAGSVPAQHAERLSDYYDTKIAALVAHLEGRVGLEGLRQIRNEAYNSRIVYLLRSIERQLAALTDPDRGGHDEAEFVALYRHQACELYGYLEPPNFQRRDPIPVTDVYLPTEILEDISPERTRPSVPSMAPRLTVADLPRLIDRTILLGDPGGGKTTAACVLMNLCAGDPTAKIPFLVTLGEYAAKSPPERSIVEHIEHALSTSYECRPPNGLVERLLRTGSALVIFDALDELLDNSRRRGVSKRIEQFCSAYPLVPVLVTSREIGYDRARLKDDQFTCYRLGGFGRQEVEEYARKWFASPGKAEAFLSESARADDLRSNPLLLSLMCILYQDAGSLPVNRAGLYEQCAALLLRKWDEERGIRHGLRARVVVEPVIRHLAWWLFNEQHAVIKESQFLAEVTKFLRAHGFESADGARDAAREFVEFCRERTWVLSAGITVTGEKGYTFTHRTFLEYYATAYVITELRRTPEDLAEFLADRVGYGEWDAVDRLAISVMEHAIDGAGGRVCRILLELEDVPGDRGELLSFLAIYLESARPSPATVRNLTREILGHRIVYDPEREIMHPLPLLIHFGVCYEELISDEMSSHIGTMVVAGDAARRIEALRLALEVGDYATPFWRNWSAEQANHYAEEISADSVQSSELRTSALYKKIITIEQALAMPGGLSALMEPVPRMLESNLTAPYPADLYMGLPVSGVIAEGEFAVIGRYVISHPKPPWIRASNYDFSLLDICDEVLLRESGALLDELTGLGFAAIHAMCSEVFGWDGERPWADLPMPSQFRQIFRDWADRKVNFVEVHEK